MLLLKQFKAQWVSYLGKCDAIIFLIRGGFYKEKIVINKDVVKLFPNIERDSYFVLDTFGYQPWIVSTFFLSVENLTNIIIFPLNSSLTNSLNVKMINENIIVLNNMIKLLMWKKIVFVVPKRWEQLEKVIKKGIDCESTFVRG